MSFNTNLKYYRELFRLREIKDRDKFDFFWGPKSNNRYLSARVNFNRIKRMKRQQMNEKRKRMGQHLQAEEKESMCSSSSEDEQDVNGVVRGNPYDLEEFYMRFSGDMGDST